MDWPDLIFYVLASVPGTLPLFIFVLIVTAFVWEFLPKSFRKAVDEYVSTS